MKFIDATHIHIDLFEIRFAPESFKIHFTFSVHVCLYGWVYILMLRAE